MAAPAVGSSGLAPNPPKNRRHGRCQNDGLDPSMTAREHGADFWAAVCTARDCVVVTDLAWRG